MGLNLKTYKVLSFDIYGTLIDWESVIFQQLLPFLHRVLFSQFKKSVSEREFFLSAYNTLELEI